ncbi:16S rRNA processing protein RimM [Rhizobiales bacterium GAS191]|jgi:16S rRNA processing protein RimM|nr:16S rRNA processing protein RimM [Rhizobiales bacterium GAS113]SEC31002.1 16S rRNA processing protein RimM [Rhizobiales bacterium GAS191]SEC93983.1 16S rRNA processing protein RimM [Rhizobiales bacterium GAS188]
MAAPAGALEPPRQLIRVGEIVGVHGVRGEVRLRSYAATPTDIARYSPLVSADGQRAYRLGGLRPLGSGTDMFIAHIAGVDTREAAEALAGTGLHVAREQVLAELEQEEFLHADLIGCRVELETGKTIGKIVSVQNFGAGDLIEIALEGVRRTEFLPFADAFVPLVDLAGRRVVVSSDPSASQ